MHAAQLRTYVHLRLFYPLGSLLLFIRGGKNVLNFRDTVLCVCSSTSSIVVLVVCVLCVFQQDKVSFLSAQEGAIFF